MKPSDTPKAASASVAELMRHLDLAARNLVTPGVTKRTLCQRALEALRDCLDAPAASAEPVEQYPADKVAILLRECLKPEEISGTPAVQHDRMRELLGWFVRYADRDANGKWLAGHAFELAYYIATNGCNAALDVRPIRDDGFRQGFNVSNEDREMLTRIDPEKFKPRPDTAAGEQELPALPEPELEGVDYEWCGQNAKMDCYTAAQMRDYALSVFAAKGHK